MNSVHEQCSKSDSGTVLSKKLAKFTMCTATAQPAHTGLVQAARAWLCHSLSSSVSWPGQCRSSQARVPGPCRKTLPCWPSSLCHDTKPGLAIQFPTNLPASVTIQTLYRDTAFCPANQPPVTIQPIVL